MHLPLTRLVLCSIAICLWVFPSVKAAATDSDPSRQPLFAATDSDQISFNNDDHLTRRVTSTSDDYVWEFGRSEPRFC